MLAIVQTANGTFNVFGTGEGGFWITGNATLDQLKELQAEVKRAIKESK
jgi:hypothetical protein